MFIPLALYAQEDYKPLLKEGRTWNHTLVNISREYDKSLTIWGDTIIGGNVWKKVYNGSLYEKALREDGRKVYELAKGKPADSQQLLFDFGLQVGDRQYSALYENDVRYLEVMSIEYINSGGKDYRVLKLNQVINSSGETASSDNCYWIEGIGSDCGIVQPCQWADITGYTCQLKSCYDNDECIFSMMNFYTGVTTLTSDKQKSVGIYDLQGRPVSQPSKGVYIENGRKRVVR